MSTNPVIPVSTPPPLSFKAVYSNREMIEFKDIKIQINE